MTASEAQLGAVQPAFLSVQAAADILSVHSALVYREIRAGNLKAVKIGAKVLRIPRTSLDAYIQAQLGQGTN